MSSHFAKLKEELDAQKKALTAKAAELDTRQNEVKAMQNRLDALTAIDSAINDAVAFNGRTRNENLGDVFMHLIVDEGSVDAAIHGAMKSLGTNDAAKHTLASVIEHGVDPGYLMDCIKNVMADEKPAVVDNWGLSKENQEPPKVKLPPVRQPTTTPVTPNGLRGQAADFKPLKDPEQKYNARGWQALAQSGWGNGTGGW